MATIESIASRRQLAVEKLAESMKTIGEALNIDPAVLPIQGYQDPNFTQAVQLENIANYLADVSTALIKVMTPELAPASSYEAMTVEELNAVIAERGMSELGIEGTGANGNVVKGDLIDALKADDDTAEMERALWQAEVPNDGNEAHDVTVEEVTRVPDALNGIGNIRVGDAPEEATGSARENAARPSPKKKV